MASMEAEKRAVERRMVVVVESGTVETGTSRNDEENGVVESVVVEWDLTHSTLNDFPLLEGTKAVCSYMI